MTENKLLSKSAKLRALLESSELEFIMEAHNGISAQIVEKAGFKGIWGSGLSMSAQYAVRDSNEASWTQVVDMLEQGGHGGVGPERDAPGEELEEHHAQRVDVAARRQPLRLAVTLLRAHVGKCPEEPLALLQETHCFAYMGSLEEVVYFKAGVGHYFGMWFGVCGAGSLAM